MEKVVDLNIHSKFSGGTSKRINIFNIALNSKIKGLDIVGTGDCLHPSWVKELKFELEESDNGIYYHPKIPEIKFILQTEVELIWKIEGEYNVWEGSSNFDGIPSKIIDGINKIRDGKYYFIPGHDNFYGRLCFENGE